jgi:hypothetical protein
VAPIFDGWYHEPNGTISLCFGYHSLNLSEDLDVPLGPANFVEPAQLDGAQPTHFDEVPPEYRRRFCVFTVSVPDPQAAESVAWTLQTRGEPLVAKATGSQYYRIDELDQPSRSVHAPTVRVEEPAVQPDVRGRTTSLDVGIVRARVGDRVPLTARIAGNQERPDLTARVLWTVHQGPGVVSFEEEDAVLGGGMEIRHSTGARFSAPGEYLLRLQAVDWADGNSFGFHCCWTNAYLRVSVTE